MRKLCLIAVMLVCASGVARAELKDDTVQSLMNAARAGIPGEPSPLGVETEEEKKHPIIPLEDARRVVKAGMKSGTAEWCKLDWKAHYLKFMRAERAKKLWNEKQITYVGILHGVAQSVMQGESAKRFGACSAEQAEHTRNIIETATY